MSIDGTNICRELRANSTPAEIAFWEKVRMRQVLNKKFNRQFPIFFELDGGNSFFIADFYCHEHKLIVEIDGGIHESQKDYDFLRTYILNQLNYTVIRFKNEEVLSNIDQVIKTLRGYLTNQPTKNSPSLLREGVRG